MLAPPPPNLHFLVFLLKPIKSRLPTDALKLVVVVVVVVVVVAVVVVAVVVAVAVAVAVVIVMVRAAVVVVVVLLAVLVVVVGVVVAVVPVVIAIIVVFCGGSGGSNKRINPNKPLFGPGSQKKSPQEILDPGKSPNKRISLNKTRARIQDARSRILRNSPQQILDPGAGPNKPLFGP